MIPNIYRGSQVLEVELILSNAIDITYTSHRKGVVTDDDREYLIENIPRAWGDKELLNKAKTMQTREDIEQFLIHLGVTAQICWATSPFPEV